MLQSESPEEQPSTGVLGRIGSWFSPWRGNAPKSPSENASSPSDWTENTGGDEEEFVRTHAREQRWRDWNTGPLFKSVLPCEEEDATQSAHRDGSVVSCTETGEGRPREEEERAPWRKQRTGQGEGRVETSNGASSSGSSLKNVSHLRHLSSSSTQGVAWDFDQAHTQTQAHRRAQTGKRLHVYLEETSVNLSDQDKCAGKEVVCTTVKKSLQVFARAKSSPCFDLPNSSSLSAEKNVKPAVGAQSYYSTLVGVSLNPHKGSQSEPEPDREQAEADDMGRKNANRRRVRKNSQGDGGKSPVEKKTGDAQAAEAFSPSESSATSPLSKSPNVHLKEASEDSSFSPNPTFQVLPEGGEWDSPSSDMVKHLDDFQDSLSVAGVTEARLDGVSNMEQDDSFYKVERKTETPESKRRSIKVSRSEVKLFTKQVPFVPKLNPAAEVLDATVTDGAEDKHKTKSNKR